MPFEKSQSPFSTHSPFSGTGRHDEALKAWPNDLPGLMVAIQNLLIYDVVAKPFYGVDLSLERQMDIHLRRVEDILDRAFGISTAPLTEPRPPRDRIAARCNNFGLLLLGALRQRGIAARARVGFADYFNSGKHEDHWVVEYRDPNSGVWRYADPQFDTVWRERLAISHDIADLPRDRFLTASEVWRACREGRIDPTRAGISHANLYGLSFVAGSLVRDMAALNKVEMLPWDVWGAMPPPDAALSLDQLGYFDDLAELLSDPDATLDTILRRYSGDDGLKVGETVFNALLRKTEKVPHNG